MKKLFAILLFLITTNIQAFDILALGSSNINCHNANQAFTKTLNELLIEEKISASVINAGLDGDKPQFMLSRLKSNLSNNKNIKLVIFEPGPNETNISWSLEKSKEILQFLSEKNIPSIYVSNRIIQSPEDARAFSEDNGAYFYGNYVKGMMPTREFCQLDGQGCGHLSEKGCQIWAKQMLPLVKRVVTEKGIE